MKRHRHYVVILLALLCSTFFTSCASTSKDETANEKVSTLPWNTPQDWEKSSPMGSVGY